MKARTALGSMLRRVAALVAVTFVISAAAMTFFNPSPASAAAPVRPANGVIDCTNPAEASSDACARLDSAPDCASNDTQCFTNEIDVFPAGTDTWWIDLADGVLCAGNDAACRSQVGTSDTTWVLDHTGTSSAIPTDEQAGPIPPSVGPPPPNFTNLPGSTPQACAGVVGDFSTCSIGTLAGGLEFFALVFAVGGMLVSAIFWVIGAKSDNAGQEYNGKRGFLISLVAAFVVGAIPGGIIALNHDAKSADTTGITSQAP